MSEDLITENYSKLIRTCEQCGTCTAGCPTKEVSDFNIRKLVRHLQLDLHKDPEFLEKYPWLCTLCYRCNVLCYEGLDIPRLVWALRELAIEKGIVPAEVTGLLETVRDNEGPYELKGRSKTSRIKPPLKSSDDSKILFWMGCTPSVKIPNVINSAADIMNRLGIKFKVLPQEPCCGEPVICLGLKDEARKMATKVVEAVENANVDQVVVPCSGCYDAFTKLYPEILGVEFAKVEVLHSSQFLEKKLKGLKLESPMKISYHDPCTLGRHAGIYEEPRRILEGIEGLTLVEMERNRELASCCGGGGGLPTVDQKLPQKIAKGKLEREVIPLGVDALVTSCPMCVLNFKFTAMKNKIPIKVYDISEILSMCIAD